MIDTRNIYTSGANDGLKMGIYLSMIFLFQSMGGNNLMLITFGTIMMLCIPVVAYILLRKGYRESRGMSTFSAIWLHGILIFLCGSLILAMVIYIYLRYINPSFLSDTLSYLIDIYSNREDQDASQLTDMLTTIQKQNLLPTPIQYAFTMIWTCSFFGSLLSMILALIVRAIPIRNLKKHFPKND